ncbi:hypothetical protein L905_19140 [Agrobacterium sp. TS43]|uniref:hypothetical protein n=1 Tax=Agrobacterium TaxID=357 RepID=UPI00049EC345|nr:MULTISPECIES: hypothetical protein [Agrobacterium]KDR87713.1 hypothetical protein K538_07110 [Agrobacterium tumefaciens GW4]KVK49507.1 hypothetical protein L903_19500 [Agrobacterium sp. JL28]KVK49744.1 hypothetical protein L904_19490 [Agrobacterium sp. LY4]KVK62685.1 hypothetical protein L906_18615 [Agrobacterium sp. TS45]KVK65070.1 hypothetical protein L905_19140 [Agrobacterium sp. TS43]
MIEDMSLEELIDLAMSNGEWHSIRIFNGKMSGGGNMVSMGRDHSSFVVDALVPEALPSQKLRQVLLQVLRTKMPADTSDDLLV